MTALRKTHLSLVDRKCSIEGCGKPHSARGWCVNHYGRWRNHGDPLGGGTSRHEARRYFNEVVLAYEGDKCLSWPYARDDKGYGILQDNGRHRYVSHLVCQDTCAPHAQTCRSALMWQGP